ncbi:MAG: glycosyltransferase family 2 protein [Candidatus Woesearchaeota archaeon]|nr:glycosyltransferase family 2 protein [Candidatus Woesearchaeota archaeon]
MGGKITLLIPCYNEEKGIAKVIENIPYGRINSLGYGIQVIVIDNNSKDKTAQIARRYGAKVISEKKQGKGHAIMTGFRNVSDDTDIVVMIDGDNTYDVNEIMRLIEPIDNGFCDVTLGSRLNGKIHADSMSYFNRVGNWLFTFMVRVAYQGNVTDVCTGYFAWKKEVIDRLLPHLNSGDYSIEMEMIVKMARMDVSMFSFPISYAKREGRSNLNPIKDGVKIMSTGIKYMFWDAGTASKKEDMVLGNSSSEESESA